MEMPDEASATAKPPPTFSLPDTQSAGCLGSTFMLVRFGLASVLSALAASTALAAPMAPEDKASLQLLCAGDFATFCAGLPPEDGPETRACFQKNMSKLSPGCQNAIQAYKNKD
jgi:hypothetical protein